MKTLTLNHQYEFRLHIHKGNKQLVTQLLKEEPYCSHLNELLFYQDANHCTTLYELCDIEYESIFLDIAPYISKELWLHQSLSGADMILKAVASGSIAIFNSVYDTGLFNLDRLHQVVVCSNSKDIIQKVHELGVNYTNQFLFDYVEIEHKQKDACYLATEAIKELFKETYNINPYLMDKNGNNAMHKMVSCICREDVEIIPLLSWFIQKGVSVLDKNHEGMTILDLALINPRMKKNTVSFLLKQKEFENIDELERAWKLALKDTMFRVSDIELQIKERIHLLTEKNCLENKMGNILSTNGQDTKIKNKL